MDEEIWTGLAATRASTHDLWAPETKAGRTLGHLWVPNIQFVGWHSVMAVDSSVWALGLLEPERLGQWPRLG